MVLGIVAIREIHAGANGNHQHMRMEGAILLIDFGRNRGALTAAVHGNHGIGHGLGAAIQGNGYRQLVRVGCHCHGRHQKARQYCNH